MIKKICLLLLVSSPLQALQFGDYIIKEGKIIPHEYKTIKEDELEFDKMMNSIHQVTPIDEDVLSESEVEKFEVGKSGFSCFKVVRFWIMRLCCCKRK